MSQPAVGQAARPEEIEIAGEHAVCDQNGVL